MLAIVSAQSKLRLTSCDLCRFRAPLLARCLGAVSTPPPTTTSPLSVSLPPSEGKLSASVAAAATASPATPPGVVFTQNCLVDPTVSLSIETLAGLQPVKRGAHVWLVVPNDSEDGVCEDENIAVVLTRALPGDSLLLQAGPQFLDSPLVLPHKVSVRVSLLFFSEL